MLPFDVPENYIPVAPSTMKNLEDSVVRTMNRLPEVTDQLSGILTRVDNLLGDVEDKRLPEQIMATLGGANRIIVEAQNKIAQVEVAKLSKQAEKTLGNFDQTVSRMNALLARVDGDKGLLAKVAYTTDAFGDVARNAGGLGSELETTLHSIQDTAKSIRRLTDALEKDPDMLIKGHAEGKK
jgi:paraquat-inducible protein B